MCPIMYESVIYVFVLIEQIIYKLIIYSEDWHRVTFIRICMTVLQSNVNTISQYVTHIKLKDIYMQSIQE